MRRRSAEAVSVTTRRPDSSRAMRRSNSSDGDSRPRTIARSTCVNPRASHGRTGQATKRETKARVKVVTPHGRRMKE